MAFDVSALSNYTDEQSDKYLYQTIAEGTTTSLIPNVQTGVKSAEKIKIVATTGVWQAGGSCGFAASGDTVFSERTITVGKIKINLEWCPKDLETKYTQMALTKGAIYNENALAFWDDLMTQLTNKDKSKIEQVVWNGNTLHTDAYLMRFDGLRKIIGAASGVLTTSTSGSTAWSSANSRTVMQSFAAKVSASLPQLMDQDDTVLFIGVAEYTDLKLKYITDNLYHITGDQGVMTVEGTSIPIVPVQGLSGKKEAYLMRKSNLYLGVDLESDEDKFEVWYSQDNDVIRYKKEFKMGVQIAFPDEIIKYISA